MPHTPQTTQGNSSCAGCRKSLKPEERYDIFAMLPNPPREAREADHRPPNRFLCETCAMKMRMSRGRKPHWQYLTSIKTDYLRPGKSGSS